tara:strand:+ start:595 stop:1044 length:450 start_codon:yes stop_codon:yes gene_type:complete
MILFNLLLISGLLFAAVCLWIIIQNRKKILFSFIFIPIFLIFVISTYFTINSLLGVPIEGKPPGEFHYLTHIRDNELVHLWAILENENDPKTFKFTIKRNKEEMKTSLASARQMKKKGKNVGGNFFGEKNPGKLEIYEFNHERFLPSKK